MLTLAAMLISAAIEGRANSEGATERPSEDMPLPPAEAASRMTLPEGFNVTLFAGEPDVVQPIAFTIDDRGRLWVVECFSYPIWQTDGKPGRDRIVIFEDTDGDGRFDRRTVFYDKGANFTGIALGFGGVWICATPNLLFIPDGDSDDIPDGDPVIVLDGWDLNCKHNAFNALNWGPDGWLYGCNGILSNSKVGRPGSSDAERVPINCGVWRYHPTKRIFEAFAHGTTNPWGLDFDDHGEMFITNCVIAHLFHVVPGAHFQRMFGQDISPHAYALMESCADHIHWGGGDWTSSRGGKGIHSEAGGGHAHAGAMVYLGDNWPDQYRNSAFMCNIHGNRVNQDSLERSDSGYVAHHKKDFLFANDEWFRGLELKYGPDGGVFITDWSDTGECHNSDPKTIHQETGRIYKVTYGQPRKDHLDLAKLTNAELVKLQLHRNDWYVRHARRLLQERAAGGDDLSDTHRALWEMFHANEDVTRKLRSLWALHATAGLNEEALAKQLHHESEYVRGWAVRLLCDSAARPSLTPAPLSPRGRGRGAGGEGGENLRQKTTHSEITNVSQSIIGEFVSLAKNDPSPLVQLNLAAALQRLPLEQRWTIASALLEHGDDARDPNLPLMIWYGVEPLVSFDHAAAATLAGRSRIPLLRQFFARRIVLESDPAAGGPLLGLTALVQVLGQVTDPAIQLDLLAGIREALKGRKNVLMDKGWPALYAELTKDPTVREQAMLVALIFRDAKAIASLEATMSDSAADAGERQRALQALVDSVVPDLAPQLHRLLADPAMRGPAIRGLAVYSDKATPGLIVSSYRSLNESERADAVGTLASRPPYALALLDAVEKGVVPSHDLSAFTVRQLQAFGNKQIDGQLAKVWGSIRPTSKEKSALMGKTRATLTREHLKTADLSNGRIAFNRTCAQCHKLYGVGGDVGPDLTGSNRANLDYILENVLDPNAVVAREYKLTLVATTDGRLISGIIRERSDKTLVIQTPNDRIIISSDDIEEMKESPSSMMPEGGFDKLTADEIRDLVAYLATKSQVPLPGN